MEAELVKQATSLMALPLELAFMTIDKLPIRNVVALCRASKEFEKWCDDYGIMEHVESKLLGANRQERLVLLDGILIGGPIIFTFPGINDESVMRIEKMREGPEQAKRWTVTFDKEDYNGNALPKTVLDRLAQVKKVIEEYYDLKFFEDTGYGEAFVIRKVRKLRSGRVSRKHVNAKVALQVAQLVLRNGFKLQLKMTGNLFGNDDLITIDYSIFNGKKIE